MTNLNTSVDRIIPNRQVPAAITDTKIKPQTGDKVYLYNDPKYTGTLIRPPMPLVSPATVQLWRKMGLPKC